MAGDGVVCVKRRRCRALEVPGGIQSASSGEFLGTALNFERSRHVRTCSEAFTFLNAESEMREDDLLFSKHSIKMSDLEHSSNFRFYSQSGMRWSQDYPTE